ncbi:hypothetical protein DFH11DRAFT_825917 [Phellopilus nigrolimitatus]|nr:hypothetical protein DFH11DRAFT_825917 [Phellopilus nigrolimitatus]
MPYYPIYAPRRSALPLGGYGRENTAAYSSTLTMGATSYYKPLQPLGATKPAPTNPIAESRREDIWHLPAPEAGSSPPSWEEWENNSNWPFPANQPRKPLRKPSPEPAPSIAERKSTAQVESDRNANWPHPAPAPRKRTTSQLSSRAAAPQSRPAENTEQKQNADWPLPTSNAPKKPVDPPANPRPISRPPSQPRADVAPVSPLLTKGSPTMVYFDLRLPYTCARKLVKGTHWTHLNHDNLKQPASQPPRERMHIYTAECPNDWVIEVRARPNRGWSYVTVENVLEALYEGLNRPIEHDRWARDSVNPRHAQRVTKAFHRRVELLEKKRPIRFEDARKKGLLRIDYLGSQCRFAGLVFGGEGSEWWMLNVSSEPTS